MGAYYVYMPTNKYVDAAIARERELKGWRRPKENALVETLNPSWADLLRMNIAKGPSLRSG
jgi:putative endonuclease